MSLITDREILIEKIARSLASYDLNLEDPERARWRYGHAYHLRHALIDQIWRDRIPQAKIIARLLGAEAESLYDNDHSDVPNYSEPLDRSFTTGCDRRTDSIGKEGTRVPLAPTVRSAFKSIAASLGHISQTLHGF